MALANYSDLITAVADWSHRSVSQSADFVTLAESRINSELQSRMDETESTLTGTIGTRYIALPSGFFHQTSLWCTTYSPRIEVRYIPAEILPVSTTASRPYYYTVDGSNLAFECPHDIANTYTLRYKKAFNIASTLTNDILTRFPGVYLYSSLSEAALFARDMDAVSVFEQKFQDSLQAANKADSLVKSNATVVYDSALNQKNVPNIQDGGI